MSDYPDFMDSIAPVPLPEASAGYYEPFFLNTSVSIGAGASYTYTYNIPSADYIYAVDSISVSASDFIYMRVAAFLNDEVFMWQQAKGAVSHIFTDNPSLVFIYGDKLQINITNLDSSARTFYISVVGTRFVRPVGYSKPPTARFTFTPEWIFPGETVYFTDQSKYSPTSWDWDFDDGSPHSSQQHPTHIYENEGIYYPKLTACNEIGCDTMVSSTPVNVASCEDLTTYTKSDPYNRILELTSHCVKYKASNKNYPRLYRQLPGAPVTRVRVRISLNSHSGYVDGCSVTVLLLNTRTNVVYPSDSVPTLCLYILEQNPNLTLRYFHGNGSQYSDRDLLNVTDPDLLPIYLELDAYLTTRTVTVKQYNASYTEVINTWNLGDSNTPSSVTYMHVAGTYSVNSSFWIKNCCARLVA